MIISEKESKLLIDSKHGQRVMDEMKRLVEIGPFTFGKNVLNEVQDAYFDTKNFDLARKDSYLRIRGRKDGHLITVRHSTTQGRTEAAIDEVTHPLDDKGIQIALSSLAENIKLPGAPQLSLPHFSEILQSVGIEEVLRVRIDRVERELFMEDLKIGRVKMDVFHYVKPQPFGPFFEIEVDSYKQALHKSAADFFANLTARFDEVAQVSSTSKYIRGINIAYGLTL